MIRFDHVTVTYAGAPGPVLRDVDLADRARASCAWSSAAPASGKSTLLGAINGLVPHFTGGTLRRPGHRRRPRHPRRTRRASSPTSSASSARTRWPASSPTRSRRSSPTAWSSSAVPPDVMRKRVEETLDLLGLAELRRRPLRDAVRRAAAAGRDRRGADRAPAGARARRADLGARPDRRRGRAGRDHPAGARPRRHRACSPSTGSSGSSQYADRVVLLPGDGTRSPTARRPTMLADSPVAPPVVELGRLAGWQPLPLSVRDARRRRRAAARPAGRARTARRRRRSASARCRAGRARGVVGAGTATWSPSAASTSTCAPARSSR